MINNNTNGFEERSKEDKFMDKLRPYLKVEFQKYFNENLSNVEDKAEKIPNTTYKEIKQIVKSDVILIENEIKFFMNDKEKAYEEHFRIKKNVINAIPEVIENTVKKKNSSTEFTPSYVPLPDLLNKIIPYVKKYDALIQFKSNSADSDVINICLVFQTQYAIEYSNVFFNYRLYSGTISDNITPVQEIGSVLTYLKRYLLMGFFCIATADGVDPDNYPIQKNNNNYNNSSNHNKSGFKKLDK